MAAKPLTLKRFVLLAGVHVDAEGTHYPGDVVKGIDLEQRFPEKFIAWTPTDEAALEAEGG